MALFKKMLFQKNFYNMDPNWLCLGNKSKQTFDLIKSPSQDTKQEKRIKIE